MQNNKSQSTQASISVCVSLTNGKKGKKGSFMRQEGDGLILLYPAFDYDGLSLANGRQN